MTGLVQAGVLHLGEFRGQIEQVDDVGRLEVPALHQHGGALLPDELGGEPHIVLGLDLHLREDLGLALVRGDELADREELPPQGVGQIVVHQGTPRAGDHDRVDDQGGLVVLQDVRHGADDLGIVEHPRLYRFDVGVLQDRLQLLFDELLRQREDAVDAARVLRGDGCDDSRGMDPHGGHGLHIGLDASAPYRVRACDRECRSHA